MDARKRWMTAIRPDAGLWRVGAPEPVGPPETLLERLRHRARGAPVALGIDCPLGLPRAYAVRHAASGWAGFGEFLTALPADAEFLHVAASLAEVSAARPFYPARGLAGMTRSAHAQALGLNNAAELSRACDRATASRPAGAPLFWTLGANQSGKAAIAAWRYLIGPALRGPDPPRLWPFDGPLLCLLADGGVVIAETYPAEALRQLGLVPAGSKRRQSDRAAHAPLILAAMARLGAAAESEAAVTLSHGFGEDAAGEDRFDSMLGALCVLSVITGHRPDTAPDDPWITRWEGWVLGQTLLPAGYSAALSCG